MQTNTAALLLLCALSSCLASGDPVRGPSEDDTVLARVDGKPVAGAAYRCWLADVYGKPARDEYIGLWLMEREARRLCIEVSAQEIDTARESLWTGWIRERLNGDPSALDEELARQGHDRASYQRWFYWQKRRELLASKIIRHERKIDETLLQQRFERDFGPQGVRTQVRLLVLTRARLALKLSQEKGARTLTAAELDEQLMENAQAIRARALAGEKFEDLVRAESDDLAVRKNGGLCDDQQWRVRGLSFVHAAEAAPLNVVQAPVANSSGIDLFEVVSREQTAYADVRENLRAQLLAETASLEEVTALDRRLRSASRIEQP